MDYLSLHRGTWEISSWYPREGHLDIGCAKRCQRPAVARSQSMGGPRPRSRSGHNSKDSLTVYLTSHTSKAPGLSFQLPMSPSLASDAGVPLPGHHPPPCRPNARLEVLHATVRLWYNLARELVRTKGRLWQDNIYIICHFRRRPLWRSACLETGQSEKEASLSRPPCIWKDPERQLVFLMTIRP